MAGSVIDAYFTWADGLGEKVVEWARDGRPAGPTGSWPFAGFGAAFAIALAYFVFVMAGRRIMDKFQALDDKTYMMRFAYNVVQVMLCSYMCIEAGVIAWREGYSMLPCVPFKTENPPVANVLWLFYVSKILDFMDTVFIVLGKKWKQLSFLHVYHHITIFLFYWLNLNAGYDGDVYLTIVLNGFIHTVMYTYYFLSMHSKDIWWKSYLTLMQMIQFVGMTSQAGYLMLTGCQQYPIGIVRVYCGYILSLLFLFANFYVKSYLGKGKNTNGAGKKGQ